MSVINGVYQENKVTGRKADAILAAHYAAEAALRLIKPGNDNYTVTEAIQKVAESYKCKPIEGEHVWLEKWKYLGDSTYVNRL